jgi:regulator of nucleoside diphosphate kinase
MEKDMNYLRMDLAAISMMPEDNVRLGRLADAAMQTYPQTAEYLAREVERAEVLTSSSPPPGLITMGSRVQFRNEASGEVRDVTLVYPHEADSAAGRISVLTPIGAALIGLRVGQSIEWQTPNGEWRTLTVLRVDGRQV